MNKCSFFQSLSHASYHPVSLPPSPHTDPDHSHTRDTTSHMPPITRKQASADRYTGSWFRGGKMKALTNKQKPPPRRSARLAAAKIKAPDPPRPFW